MNSRVLVTGGAGFIGSHVVRRLLDRGYEVRVYDRLVEQVHGSAGPRHVSSGAELIRADVRDEESLRAALRGVDSVIHLAAQVGVGQSMYEIDSYVDANSRGTAVLLQLLVEASSRIGRLVVASSMSIYGEGAYRCAEHGEVKPAPRCAPTRLNGSWEARCPLCGTAAIAVPTPESAQLSPTSVYAVSKMDQEMLCLTVGDAYGIGTVALRLFNTYGPHQSLSNPYTGVGAIFASRLMNGRAPVVFEDGGQLRDFVHVDDVARAFVLALEGAVSGVALNVGTGTPVSVLDVARQLGRALDREIEPEVTGDFRAGDIRHCWADACRARTALGFTAEIPFSEGVADLARWAAEEMPDDRIDQARAELAAHGLTN